MKRNYNILLFLIIVASFNQQIKSFSVSGVLEVVKTGAGIAQLGLTVSSIGVSLWGSEDQQKMFNKVSGYLNVGLALGQGDFSAATDAAVSLKGTLDEENQDLQHPGELVDLLKGNSESPHVGVATAVGDVHILSDAELASLEVGKRVVTVDDLKLGQTSNLKKQVVFEATVPALGQQHLLVLPNSEKLVLQTRELERGLRGVAPYNTDPSQYVQIVVHHVQNSGKYKILKEMGSIVEKKAEFAKLKTIWCNITNNSFGIFHVVGNDIILSKFAAYKPALVNKK